MISSPVARLNPALDFIPVTHIISLYADMPIRDRRLAMKELVRIFKALGDDTRIRILKLLQEKDCCVCELTEVLGLAQSTVSGQLRVLKDAGADARDDPHR